MNTTTSYPHKLLRALDKILQSSESSTDEKLQAAKLMLEPFNHRKVPKRQSQNDKAVIAALNKGKKATPPESGT